VNELKKRVILARQKRAARLRENYRLARNWGYSAEESTIIMNRGKGTINEMAEREGRLWSDKKNQL